ncbi:peptide-methionine (R)-S-oxide reductase MsrB [Conservatibacter flavescens]|uniref:Peptide methionine sulfoxide reductase MsrB n=1 Tax=Conservatibacter flavescens TaxID=28161 RepID=A0A2M8S453_9PAST|nr:peptide-methionine (R)-S-oxide reductase MsrB [Conservatibacter flavescens]PJG85926.1 peptide-methionine (R)-S-oxide reductase [Conservatibacter flavescens]
MKSKSELTPLQVEICLNRGTERPFTGKLLGQTHQGIYRCVVCHEALFQSETKFESGCGWPSFFEAISKSAVRYLEDHSHGMHRVEIRCGHCDSHLGHVFNDGPTPTGLRYCVNSVSMCFEDQETGEMIEG